MDMPTAGIDLAQNIPMSSSYLPPPEMDPWIIKKRQNSYQIGFHQEELLQKLFQCNNLILWQD